MTRTRSAALVRNGSFSAATAVSARPSGAALISGVSLSVLAAVMAAGGGAPMAHAQTITLSGSQTTTQSVNGAAVEVETAPGFNVDTATGPAISLNGSSGTSFTDANTSAITGQTDGIYIRNTENGALSLTTTRTVTGRTSYGILARNLSGEGSSPTSLTLSTAAVSGVSGGIHARNRGTGALSITSTGMVSASNGYGIMARNDVGTDLTIIATAVTGSRSGIRANNYGSGSLSITTTETVSGTSRSGIEAISDSGNLTVSSAIVNGAVGIAALLRDGGALSITSTGTVTGTDYNGIYAYSRATDRRTVGETAPTSTPSTDLTISTVAVSGLRNGIGAYNFGTGALSITSNGDVTGTNQRGIYAVNGNRYYSKALVDIDTFEVDIEAPTYSRPRPTDLTIAATSVTGGTDGIFAINNGTGALSITTTGTVTGTSRRGIFASNGGSESDSDYGDRVAAASTLGGGSAFYAGTDLTISTAAVSGGTDGIYASNFGTGALKITSTGTVTGSNGVGIFASNGGRVNGYYYYYGGDTRLAQTGESCGTYANAGTDLTVIATSAFGTQHGIFATNYGTGALSITSTGEVATTGGSGSAGIYAYNAASGTDLTINAAKVSGDDNGITAINYGTGKLAVTVSGAVMGGTLAGISTQTPEGAPVEIHMTATSSVGATSGAAILDGDGDAVVTVDGGAVVNGSIALGNGNDTLTFRSGAMMDGVTTLDGGSGEFIDTLNLNSQWTGDVSSWEIVNADTTNGNFTLNGAISGADELNKLGVGNLVLTGMNTLTGGTFIRGGRLSVNGSLVNSVVTVLSGGTLGGTGTLGTVIVQSGGTFAPGNSIGTISVAGDLTLAAGSTLAMEISPTSSDLIAVTGTATIAGNLAVTREPGAYFGRTYTLLTADTVTGTFANSTFGAPIGTSFRPTLIYSPTSVSLRLDPNSLLLISGGTLKGNPLAVATAIDKAVDGGYNPQPFISLYAQGVNLSAALGQLSGELHSAERRVALQDTRIVRETAFDRLNAGPVAGPGTSSVTSEAGDVTKTV